METKEKQPGQLTAMTERELCEYILEKTRNRDLFPEKTASARKFLDQLNANRQNLIP